MTQFRIDADDPDLRDEPAVTTSTRIEPIGIGTLIADNPEMRPVVIDGVLRRGETVNVIAAAKVGKSHLAMGLAWSIASGTPWLSHDVVQGRVLVIDNELHPQTIASRNSRIANEMQIDVSQYSEAIEVIPLRGHNLDIHAIEHRIATIEPGTYTLVIVDALYRTLPAGTSENDNAGMTSIYNKLDYYASSWDCAIAVIHHASKGQQGDKAVTDVGSGAGSISRACDTQLVIRPHEDPELSVLECVTRSFKSPEPVSIRFDYPLWHAVACEPTVKKSRPAGAEKQTQLDQKADEAVSSALDGGKKLSVSQLRTKTAMGPDRILRSLKRLGAVGRTGKSKRTGKISERFSLPENTLASGAVEWRG